MPVIDFKQVETPKFVRPELLRHHTIPRPMSGMAPRVVMGQEWWDDMRHKAYAENNMRCWACGGDGPLEAHEAYSINYYKAQMTYIETTALCNACHSFIHIGRTIGLFSQGKICHRDAKRIVLKGYETLKAAGLRCPWETRVIASNGMPWRRPRFWVTEVLLACDPVPESIMTEWASWRLVFEGEKYPPLYKTFEEYKERYK